MNNREFQSGELVARKDGLPFPSGNGIASVIFTSFGDRSVIHLNDDENHEKINARELKKVPMPGQTTTRERGLEPFPGTPQAHIPTPDEVEGPVFEVWRGEYERLILGLSRTGAIEAAKEYAEQKPGDVFIVRKNVPVAEVVATTTTKTNVEFLSPEAASAS